MKTSAAGYLPAFCAWICPSAGRLQTLVWARDDVHRDQLSHPPCRRGAGIGGRANRRHIPRTITVT